MKKSLKSKSNVKLQPVKSERLKSKDRAVIEFASVLLQVPEEVILAKVLAGQEQAA